MQRGIGGVSAWWVDFAVSKAGRTPTKGEMRCAHCEEQQTWEWRNTGRESLTSPAGFIRSKRRGPRFYDQGGSESEVAADNRFLVDVLQTLDERTRELARLAVARTVVGKSTAPSRQHLVPDDGNIFGSLVEGKRFRSQKKEGQVSGHARLPE